MDEINHAKSELEAQLNRTVKELEKWEEKAVADLNSRDKVSLFICGCDFW